MIGQIFDQVVTFLGNAIYSGSTVTDGGLAFIQAGSTGAEQAFGTITGSLGNIFD